MPVRAIWNNEVIAESNSTRIVEGNHYFPPESIKNEFLETSSRQSVCPWKGVAHYYDVVVGGERNPGAAWFYPVASAAAKEIENYLAFWQGVKIEKSGADGKPAQGGRLDGLFGR